MVTLGLNYEKLFKKPARENIVEILKFARFSAQIIFLFVKKYPRMKCAWLCIPFKKKILIRPQRQNVDIHLGSFNVLEAYLLRLIEEVSESSRALGI